jgi:copper transport protein
VTRRALIGASVLAGAILLGTAQASAHSALLSSDPVSGAFLDAAPSEIVLTFSEPPDPSLSAIDVLDEHGEAVAAQGLRAMSDDPSSLILPVGSLADGVYTVTWKALSAVDGHLTEGAFAFGVGVNTLGEAEHAAAELEHGGAPSALSVAARWSLYIGLALMVGAATMSAVVLRSRVPGARWAIPVSWAIAAVGFGTLAYVEASSAGVSVSRLLTSDAGDRLVRLGIMLAITAVVALVVAIRPSRGAFVALGTVAIVTMLAFALSGHAGAPDRFRWAWIGTQWLHLVAIGVWVGGLAWLLATLWSMDAPEKARAVRRFSQIAGIALAFVVLTGVLRAVNAFGSFSALFDTGYGTAFIWKLALFLPLLGLGALNRYRVLPRLERENPGTNAIRRTVSGEVLLGVGVFAVTGIMAGLIPPTQEAMHEEQEMVGVVVTGSDFATSIKVRLEIAPGMPGPNEFMVRVTDYDSGEPIDAGRVALRFSRPDVGPSVLELEPSGDEWMGQGTVLALAGHWTVTVIVEAAPEGWEVPLEVEIGATGGDRDHPSDVETHTTGPTGAPTGASGATLPPA